MEVLYIDDDPDDFELFSEALRNLDNTIKLDHVDGCEEAIARINNSSIRPDVIFVDRILHKMNGLECVRQIKENTLLSSVPIVVISSTIPSQDVDEFNRLGVYYFLSKTALLSKIEPALKVIIDSLCKGKDTNIDK